MCVCVRVWVCGCVGVWVGGWVGEWVCGCISAVKSVYVKTVRIVCEKAFKKSMKLLIKSVYAK